jgi:hypothetical protein
MDELSVKGFFLAKMDLLRPRIDDTSSMQKELVELGHPDPNNYDSF